ncbi:hypothetical protein [Lunatibacter salilacus]|uniref:hypothetical protein n=1 Tax=Lunatibacter salilacus TaxID=2483804 RepID=UPI00131B5CB1|nr:hypothetical protein [Lunatibacter salilacus]
MNTFYSNIFTSISPFSHERINLGLLLFQESGKSIVKFSSEKLSFIKQLLPEDSFKLLKIQLKTFENLTGSKNEFELNYNQFSSSYIQYISDYTNNLISLTPPKQIDVEVNEVVFKKLYEQFVFKSEISGLKLKIRPSILAEAKNSFIPKVKERVNVDYQLKASEFDFMVFNLQVDLIGKNDVPVLTQFVDFQGAFESIKRRINDYVSIIKPFEINEEGKVGKYFIIGQEPNKELGKQHSIWKNLMVSPLISKSIVQVVHPNELDEVQEYFEKHDVKPFEPIKN